MQPSPHHYHTTDLPSPSPSHTSFYDNSAQINTSSLVSNFNENLLRQYFASQPTPAHVITSLPTEQVNADQSYMTEDYGHSSPAIRIQQSTPIPQLNTGYAQEQAMADSDMGNQSWGMYEGNNMNMQNTQMSTPTTYRKSRTHNRVSSNSSIGSSHSFGSAQGLPYSGSSEDTPHHQPHLKVGSSYGAADEASSAFTNHLPTPTQTPTQDTFSMQNYSNAQNFAPTMAAHYQMSGLMSQQQVDDDVPGFSASERHSVSSVGHNSPVTPHTAIDDDFKIPSNGEISSSRVETWIDDYLLFDDADYKHSIPKFERTMTDACNDELYYPHINTSSAVHTQPMTSNPSLLSPYTQSALINERLKAASQARSQSPTSQASRGVSPFRHGSPHAPMQNFNSPRAAMASASQMREQQKAEAEAYALKRNRRSNDPEPKTISPKDAVLDYNESDQDTKMPLFPGGGASDYDQSYTGGDSYTQSDANFDTSSSQNYSNVQAWSRPQSTSNFPATSTPAHSNFTFVPPSIPGGVSSMSFPTSYPAQTSMAPVEQTPEFPAHLTSMESSMSEAGNDFPGSSQGSMMSAPTSKPQHTQADTGTYSCTYHGCMQRFETPQKLQKHKREGHRQNPAPQSTVPASPSVGTGMTSAALAARNSQAGPHKCERTNPQTGKPCNAIFSRPYDLTRHEDTIHNARKQKVRCALCVEEKTFSRNDALTRHMRVVHPEIDFPGKHRRRGGARD